MATMIEFKKFEAEDPAVEDDGYDVIIDGVKSEVYSVQINGRLLYLNKWIEEEEAMDHLGVYKDLDALERALRRFMVQ